MKFSKMEEISRWSVILVRFVSAQGVVQLLGLVTGILIVRSMEKAEYAQYSVITALVSAMILLSDSGISSALLSLGAKYVTDQTRLGALFVGGLKFRRKFGLVVIVAGDVMLFILLLRIKTSFWLAILYIIIVTISFVPLLTKGIIQNHLRLNLDYSSIQGIALRVALIRALIISTFFFLNGISVTVLLLLGIFVAFFEVRQMKLVSKRSMDYSATAVESDLEVFRMNVKKTLPMNIFLVLQGQALYFLIGFMGTSEVLAEVAAMSRFSLVFVILNTIVTDMGSGIVARKLGSRGSVFRLYCVFLTSYLIVAGLLIALARIFDEFLLGLLGGGYMNLEKAFILVAIGAATINFGNAMSSLNHARGWIHFSWILIPFTIIWLIYGILFVDMKNIFQASIFMGLQAVPNLITQSICLYSGLTTRRRFRIPQGRRIGR